MHFMRVSGGRIPQILSFGGNEASMEYWRTFQSSEQILVLKQKLFCLIFSMNLCMPFVQTIYISHVIEHIRKLNEKLQGFLIASFVFTVRLKAQSKGVCVSESLCVPE